MGQPIHVFLRIPLKEYCRMGRSVSHLIIVIAVFSFNASTWSQEDALNFFALSRVDGLSNNHVTAIIKDSEGYMWFGTTNGLNRYNGYEFTTFLHSRNDTASLPGNNITSLEVDAKGNLWVGCMSSGLARYDKLSGTFARYHLSAGDSNADADYIHNIVIDNDNRLWAGTSNGLFHYIQTEDKFEKLSILPDLDNWDVFNNDTDVLTLGNIISSVSKDENNGVWVVYPDWTISHIDLNGGISRHYNDLVGYRISQASVITDILNINSKLFLAANNQGLIVLDLHTREIGSPIDPRLLAFPSRLFKHEEHLWISSWDGLFKYELATGAFNIYNTHPSDPKSLSAASIGPVYIDDLGIIWLGAGVFGINYSPLNMPFRNIYYSTEDIQKLYHPGVSAMLHDSKGNFWIAFQSGIVQMYKPGDEAREIIPVDPLIPDAGVGHIFKLLESSSGTIYISSWQGGLQRFDKKKRRFVKLETCHESFTGKFGGIDIRDIAESPDGSLWLAVFGKGLLMYDPVTGNTRSYRADPTVAGKLSNDYIYGAGFDHQGNLWVSSTWGLNRLPAGDSLFITYFSSEEPLSLADSYVHFTFVDSGGKVWVVTNGGLSLYDPGSDGFINFSNEQFGFSDLLIRSIMEDDEGNIWMATTRGIIKLALQSDVTGVFVNVSYIFDLNHGILSDDFFTKSSSKDMTGRIYFGGNRGIDFLNPDEIFDFSVTTVPHIDEIRIFNVPVNPGSANGPPLNSRDEIVFSYKENMVTLQYAMLNYIESSRNRYFYKLEPLHSDWHNAGLERRVTFTNMAPGHYTFMVKSCVSSLFCEGEASMLKFYIKPPFWKTRVFTFFIISAFLVMAIIVPGLRTARIRMKKDMLEKLVARSTLELKKKNIELTRKSQILSEANDLIRERNREIEIKSRDLSLQAEELGVANRQLRELNSMKDKFFTIVAHDLRSPLSILSSFSHILDQNHDKYDNKKRAKIIGIILDSVNKILMMLDNLTQWASSQTNMISVNEVELFPRKLVDETFSIHNELFRKKNISFTNTVCPGLIIKSDPEILRVIFRNLITNASKFTSPGGDVQIGATTNGNSFVRFDVTDSGHGIPGEMIDHLFRVDTSTCTSGTGGEKGTGLGLILCHEFISKLGGEIWVEKTSDAGTTFSFTVPLS
jgi:signal transduction histidine kinase/ligand-binding sensor domain-containing protein